MMRIFEVNSYEIAMRLYLELVENIMKIQLVKKKPRHNKKDLKPASTPSGCANLSEAERFLLPSADFQSRAFLGQCTISVGLDRLTTYSRN